MNAMSAEVAGRRETLVLAAPEARLVDRLMDPNSLERWALRVLTEIENSASKAVVLRAAFRAGADRIAQLTMDEGYRQLAEQTIEAEAADERAIVASRRARAAAEEHCAVDGQADRPQ